MGKSQPPPQAEVDLVHSYARFDREDVEIQLARPTVSLTEGDTVVLRGKGQRHEATLTETGDGQSRRIVLRCSRAALTDGTWALRLVSGDTRTSLGCRLLVQGERPPVLLWGSEAPTTVLPTPHPRAKSPASGRTLPGTARAAGKRVVRTASRLSRRARRSG